MATSVAPVREAKCWRRPAVESMVEGVSEVGVTISRWRLRGLEVGSGMGRQRSWV